LRPCLWSGAPHLSSAATSTPSSSTADAGPGVFEALAAFANTPTPEGLSIAAPDLPAYVYLDGWRLLDNNDALNLYEQASYVVEEDALVAAGEPTLDDVVLDDEGLIVDLSREGRPVSETVFPIYQVVEGIDEG
jgi:hypothetical protein